MPDNLQLTIVFPTKNEAGSIAEMIGEVDRVCQKIGIAFEILVVDAGSIDGTGERAKNAGARVMIQTRPQYAGAILDAFDAAAGEFVLTCDADGSHPAAIIENLWREHERADLVIASRFVPGGKSDMSAFRFILSRVLNFTFSTFLGVRVKDMSSGYRLYRKQTLAGFTFEGGNLSILQDIVSKLYLSDHRVVEVPFHYMPRRSGRSKSQALRFAESYLRTLFRLIRFKQQLKKVR